MFSHLGPGTQPGSVITSGTAIDVTLTSFPANVSFNIIDDRAALEPVERYTLTLVPSDPSVIINQGTADIAIIDDDSKSCHFSVCFTISLFYGNRQEFLLVFHTKS